MYPIASRFQMTELDRLMGERYNISIPQMMEIAGLLTAQLAIQVSKGKKILILCGHGNNGGDGLCAARHLINFGYDITIVIAKENLGDAAALQKDVLKKMNVTINVWPTNLDFSKFDLIIDALLGFNLNGAPKEPYASIIRKANSAGVPIISVDIPSGLDADSGVAYEPCIKANYTLCMGAVKNGCKKEFCGEIYIGYIGVPAELYEGLKIEKPAFTGLIQKIQL
ncbi:MAG TPA: NAD(P)H-hydrate epimerase [Candidatus Nanoarchaeia archaeon]|nr:NAD(P)H-hydrate epimerase [Candidatus Nanoarchaeia archaeon]